MEEIVRNPTYAEAIAHAIFGAPSASMLVASLVASPIELTRKELEAAKERGEIDPEVDSRTLARQLEMQRWGIIMALSVNQVSVDHVAREVNHALVRILLSAALPDAREMLNRILLESK